MSLNAMLKILESKNNRLMLEIIDTKAYSEFSDFRVVVEKVTYKYSLSKSMLSGIKNASILSVAEKLPPLDSESRREYIETLHKFDIHTISFLKYAIYGKRNYIVNQQNSEHFSYFNLVQDMIDYIDPQHNQFSPENWSIYLIHIFHGIRLEKGYHKDPIKNLIVILQHTSCFDNLDSEIIRKSNEFLHLHILFQNIELNAFLEIELDFCCKRNLGNGIEKLAEILGIDLDYMNAPD